MDKLAAVNEILATVGQRPVSALDPGGASEAAEVERILDKTDLEVQSDDWHFNLILDKEVSPDGSGYINLPNAAIWMDSDGRDAYRDVSQRGGRLYDKVNNTDVWTVSSMRIKYAERWDFDCIPFPVREYITRYAAYKYGKYKYRRDRALLSDLYEEMVRARAHARSTDARIANVNAITSSDLSNVRGYRNRDVGWGDGVDVFL